jgi:CBS domain-containing protein
VLLPAGAPATVGAVMHGGVPTVHADTPLAETLEWLGGGRRPDGLEVAPRGRTAADVMTNPVVTVTLETTITEAIGLMIAHKIERLPVVDADGRLVGLVGRAGVLAAVSHQDGTLPPEES